MTAISSSLSLVATKNAFYSGGVDGRSTAAFPATQLTFRRNNSKPQLSVAVRAQSGGGGGERASIFIGGFVLGGIIVGTLGCVYAPQISKALTGTDRKDLMRKLPKFIYDEEKALEKTRKVLAEKIAQLNSAIDDVSSQLRSSEDAPNGTPASAMDEVEASI